MPHPSQNYDAPFIAPSLSRAIADLPLSSTIDVLIKAKPGPELAQRLSDLEADCVEAKEIVYTYNRQAIHAVRNYLDICSYPEAIPLSSNERLGTLYGKLPVFTICALAELKPDCILFMDKPGEYE